MCVFTALLPPALAFFGASYGGVLCSVRGAADLGGVWAVRSPGCVLRVHRANAFHHGGFALLYLQAGLPQCVCHQGAYRSEHGLFELGFRVWWRSDGVVVAVVVRVGMWGFHEGGDGFRRVGRTASLERQGRHSSLLRGECASLLRR